MNTLRNETFELVDNVDGHAKGGTRLVFTDGTDPINATYTGVNVVFGTAIVNDNDMVYQAMTSDGELNAGRAKISFEDDQLVLHWEWLTGDRSSGVSRWRRISNEK